MKKTNITVPFDADRLDAIRHFSPPESQSLEDEILSFIEKIYLKKVPANVREFLAATASDSDKPPSRTRKQDDAGSG